MIRLCFIAALILLASCTSKTPEFEILGIRLDTTTLESAGKIHLFTRCNPPGTLLPDKTVCFTGDVEVAKIRSYLSVTANRNGIVTDVTIRGSHYDGPFENFKNAMIEKYGPPQSGDDRSPVWLGSNGIAELTKESDGGATLSFRGKRGQQDEEAARRYREKGRKF